MASRALQAAPWILSVTALAASILAIARPHDSPVVAAQPLSGDDDSSPELSRKLAELQSRLEALSAAPNDFSTRSPAAESPLAHAAAIAELQKRVSDLETAIAALQRLASAPRQIADEPVNPDVVAARNVILDPRASDKAKIAAMRALRGVKINGQDALSHDLVLALLGIVDRSADPRARRDVYMNLHRINDPSLRDAMLSSLVNDPDPSVREKVAEDIDSFLPDPAIEAALHSAADSDPSDGVRSHARRTLNAQH